MNTQTSEAALNTGALETPALSPEAKKLSAEKMIGEAKERNAQERQQALRTVAPYVVEINKASGTFIASQRSLNVNVLMIVADIVQIISGLQANVRHWRELGCSAKVAREYARDMMIYAGIAAKVRRPVKKGEAKYDFIAATGIDPQTVALFPEYAARALYVVAYCDREKYKITDDGGTPNLPQQLFDTDLKSGEAPMDEKKGRNFRNAVMNAKKLLGVQEKRGAQNDTPLAEVNVAEMSKGAHLAALADWSTKAMTTPEGEPAAFDALFNAGEIENLITFIRNVCAMRGGQVIIEDTINGHDADADAPPVRERAKAKGRKAA